LTEKFRQVAPEAVVILGNDQREFFTEELTPAITVYRGAEIHNVQHVHENQPGLNIAEVGNAPEEGATYPGDPDLADHILRSLNGTFDVAQSSATPQNAIRHGIPHAYGFLYHSILRGAPPPSVPIILNVHYPYNQPKVARCLELGRALQQAIRNFAGYRRVALMASGGLSHFVIDEDLDRSILTAMRTGDEGPLLAIPENIFKVGTAEIKNWFPVIAAMNAEGRAFHSVDYVPCYRSEAGTGNAMGFVYWE
jgi:OH-DDVA oxygenase